MNKLKTLVASVVVAPKDNVATTSDATNVFNLFIIRTFVFLLILISSLYR